MEKIRKGNDIRIKWAIYAGKGVNELPYDLTGKNITIYLKNAYDAIKVTDFIIEKHIIKFMFWGAEQEHTGSYSLTLVENEGLKGMRTVDECDAFALVNHSFQTGGKAESHVECKHLRFRTNFRVGEGAGVSIVVDDKLSLESENPVQNKVVTEQLYKSTLFDVIEEIDAPNDKDDSIILDNKLSLTSENGVKNKVITLALQEETLRAKASELKLEKSISGYDSKLELIEDSLSVTNSTVLNLMVKIDNVDDKLTRIEDAIKDVSLEEISNVLTKVESLDTNIKSVESDIASIEESMNELEGKIDTLNADVYTEGSVESKINKALDWEIIRK